LCTDAGQHPLCWYSMRALYWSIRFRHDHFCSILLSVAFPNHADDRAPMPTAATPPDRGHPFSGSALRSLPRISTHLRKLQAANLFMQQSPQRPPRRSRSIPLRTSLFQHSSHEWCTKARLCDRYRNATRSQRYADKNSRPSLTVRHSGSSPGEHP
jgi:hypothetical protein